MRELTTERGTQVIINPEHVVTIEPAQDEKGHTILGVIVVLLDLFPIGPGQFVTIRVRGTLKEVGDALGFGAAEGRAPSLSLA